MLKKILLIVTVIIMGLTSCGSFVHDEYIPRLKSHEKKVYVLKIDVTAGETTLKKGTAVKVIVVIGDDWVKVYG